MKDWLTVIIVLLIIGIVLDGLRRMRSARRESITLSKNAKKADRSNDLRVSSSEFPSGGARVAGYRDEKVASSLNETVKKKFENKKVTLGAAQRIPEQVSLNLEESVPMLMDSIDSHTQELESEDYQDPHEPQLGDYADLVDGEDSVNEEQETPVAEAVFVEPEPQAPPTEQVSAPAPEEENSSQEPDEVLIINVMARTGQRFAGAALLQTLMDVGLKFGEMDIFHRHKDNHGDGPILFSLANMVVPGTFNLAQMEEFETPGVSIFLSLPVKAESLAAYNDMAATAKHMAEALDGELKDENRSVMTSQTIEHGRQRVIEYERKRKLTQAQR